MEKLDIKVVDSGLAHLLREITYTYENAKGRRCKIIQAFRHGQWEDIGVPISQGKAGNGC